MNLLAILAGCVQPEPMQRAGDGVALGLFASEVTYDYGPLVQEIEGLGASDVLIAVPWRLPDVHSAALRSGVPRPVVQQTLRAARDAGLAATVMPLVVLEERTDGTWRGQLAPDDAATFWSNYRTLLGALAVDAERYGAARLLVGSELNSLEADPRWPGLVEQTRARFSGELGYSANWDHYRQVPFWDALDVVAVTAYFPVDGDPGTRWSEELVSVGRFAASVDRPWMVSEYGYPALASAAERPWDETTGAAYDPALQHELLTTAVAALAASDARASFAWNWFGTGSSDERGFTPRNRPAAAVLERHFRTRETR